MKKIVLLSGIALIMIMFLAACKQNDKKPFIKLVETKLITKGSSRTLSYTFALSSRNALRSLKVTPQLIGANKDSEIAYTFEQNSYIATLNYFYELPPNFPTNTDVSLMLQLNDSQGVRMYEQIINVHEINMLALQQYVQ